MTAIPELHLTGDGRHGVVRFAREVAAAVGGRGPAGPGVHVHFTDHLFGGPEAAPARLRALAAGRPLTVTLHDLPQPGDGPRNHRRRARCYAEVARLARGVVVCSRHERALLGAPAAVIHHAVDPAPVRRGDEDEEIVVLGWVYPGKGHAEAIDAAADAGLHVTALGAPSPGHEGDAEALRRRAEARGVRLTVTGYLPEPDVRLALGRARVPLIAHRHVSASGSLATWIAAGRRPLTIANRYTRELASVRPGTMRLFHDLPAALADPGPTWQGPEADTGPTSADVARAYLRFWAACASA